MEATPYKFMAWSHKNPEVSLWINEYQACEKFGIEPHGWHVNIRKTYFIYSFINAINRNQLKQRENHKRGRL